ncbi:MAG: lamin tail domain-containing protein [Candidatus Paceibacterota bacterium]
MNKITDKKSQVLGHFEEVLFRSASILLVTLGMLVFNVFPTNAYFSDTENSVGSTFSAGLLNFTVTPSAFDPIEAALNLSTGTTTSKTIDFALASTSIGTTYFVNATNVTGDIPFCKQIRVSTLLNGNPFGNSSSLLDFKSPTTTNSSVTTIDTWRHDFTLSTTSSVQNSVCSFEFEYNGRQANPYLQTGGFSDIETTSSTLYSWGFRINKVYYNVDSTHGKKNENEWVEIYNQTDTSLDLSGWQICDDNSCDTIPNSDLIEAKGFAIITDSETTWKYWDVPNEVVKIELGGNIGDGLGNAGDRLILKRPDGVVIDEMNWQADTDIWDPGSVNVAQGDMLGRVPNGYDTDQPSDFVELKPPTVSMVNPVGGEVWYVGDSYDVQWTAHSNNSGSTDNMLKISLWYSNDSGNTWAKFASNLDNTGSYHWTLPLFINGYNVQSHTARIKAIAVGPENLMMQAYGSSEDFCPPINYDALSPADQQLVDDMVANGMIDPKEVIKGGIVKENLEIASTTDPIIDNLETASTTSPIINDPETVSTTDPIIDSPMTATSSLISDESVLGDSDTVNGTTTPPITDTTATSTPEATDPIIIEPVPVIEPDPVPEPTPVPPPAPPDSITP